MRKSGMCRGPYYHHEKKTGALTIKRCGWSREELIAVTLGGWHGIVDLVQSGVDVHIFSQISLKQPYVNNTKITNTNVIQMYMQ